MLLSSAVIYIIPKIYVTLKNLNNLYNVNVLDNIENKDLYGKLPSISQVIQTRHLKLASQVFRDKTCPVHLCQLGYPPHGKMSHGKLANTFVDRLLRNTGLASFADLESAMGDGKLWRCYQSRHQQLS